MRKLVSSAPHQSRQDHEPHSRFRLSNVLGVAIFAIVCSLVIYGTYHLKNTPGDNEALGKQDNIGLRAFHNQIYLPVRALATGENPYSADYSEFHPDSALGKRVAMNPVAPSTLLILSPFAFLQLQVAEVAYIGLCVLLSILCAYMLMLTASNYSPSIGSTMLAAALMMACLPGIGAFISYPTIMVTFFGVLLAIEYSGRHNFVSGFGILLAFCQPVIGLGILILILFRRHFGAFALGITFLLLANFVTMAWIGNHTDGGISQAVEDARAEYSSLYEPVVGEDVYTSSKRVDAHSAVARIFPTESWVTDQPNLHYYIAGGILLLALIALLAERDKTQMTGLASRSGMLIAIATILYFYQTTPALFLLWIPAIGLLVDGERTKRTFSLLMRFLLGLLVVLPLFNYFVTSFAMKRLEISPNGTATGEAAPNSLRALFESWQIANPDFAQWQTVVTANTVLISVALLLIALRMIFSSVLDRKIIAQQRVASDS